MIQTLCLQTCKHVNKLVGSKVLTAVVMKRPIFWDIGACSPLKVNQLKQNLIPASCWFFHGLFFNPDDGGDIFLRNVG
jgi:hypothetical protein